MWPDSEDISLHVLDKENYVIPKYWKGEHAIEGIEVSLRNDTISEKSIDEQITNSSGFVYFRFSSSMKFKNDSTCSTWFFIDEDEYNKLHTENSNYYIIVNDTESPDYNPKYETLILRGLDLKDEPTNIYLPLKK